MDLDVQHAGGESVGEYLVAAVTILRVSKMGKAEDDPGSELRRVVLRKLL